MANFVRIEEFPNYEVSTKGEVRRISTGKLLKLSNVRGYLQARLCMNGKAVSKSVHRLVAKTHIPNIENKPCVNHKDGDKTNNSVANLEWVTYSENNLHKYRVLGVAPPRGNTSRIILYEEKNLTFKGIVECANFLKVHPSTISRYLTNKRKMPKGIILRYLEE